MKMGKPIMDKPERVARLPHFKGIPIPAVTSIDLETGTPHFKELNPYKVRQFKDERKCATCGEPLDYWIAFMVTPEEAKTREVYESPHHVDCLRYAFQLCPWLYYAEATYTPVEWGFIDGKPISNSMHPDRLVSEKRPPELGIYITRSYEQVIVTPKTYGQPHYRVCKVAPAKSIEWIAGK